MTTDAPIRSHAYFVHEEEFAAIIGGRQSFVVTAPDDTWGAVGDPITINELEAATGDLTGRSVRGVVSSVREATSMHVVGFTLGRGEPGEVYARALRFFGAEAQLRKTIEECAELILAISHHGLGRADYAKIAEEAADVEHMLAQIRMIVGDAAVDAIKAYKLDRFAKVLDERMSEMTR